MAPAGAAAAPPQYVAAATRNVATADLVASPIEDRTVAVDHEGTAVTLMVGPGDPAPPERPAPAAGPARVRD